MYWLILSSMVLQLIAAVLALRLIPQTGRMWAWICISLGLVGMVARRAYVLVLMPAGLDSPSLFFEMLGLGVSTAVLVGIAQISPVFSRLKESNRILTESEERFRTVADFTTDWEYWRLPDGTFAYISPACERVTGYPRKAFENDPELLVNIVHPHDRAVMAEHRSHEARQEGVESLDLRIVTAGGETRWISHRCAPVRDTAGTFRGIRASNRDINARKQAEFKLAQSRKRYRDLVQHAHCFILELSSSGEILFANDYTLRALGFDRDMLVGQPVSVLFPEADADTPLPRGIADLRTLFKGEGEIAGSQGEHFWVSWSGAVIPGELERPEWLLCIGIDITEQKTAEKLRDDVERIIRHDLKSPLLGIIGLPRQMREEPNITALQQEKLKLLENAGIRMMHLINQSLNLYKLETGAYVYAPRPVDWLGIVCRAAEDLSAQFTHIATVRISVDGKRPGPDDEIIIPGDATLLYGMAANLIKNGLEAAGGKPVEVEMSPGATCVMEVRNHQAVLPQMHDTFFEKYATCGKENGTGLGTYSARLATQALRGSITMHSSEQEGTVVRVELPGEEDRTEEPGALNGRTRTDSAPYLA